MKKNILVVFHDNKLASGATKSFLSNIEYLFKEGHNIIATVPNKDGDLYQYLFKMGIKVYSVPYGGNVYGYSESKIMMTKNYLRCTIKTLITFFSSIKFKNKIVNESISIVYSNTSTCYFGAWIAKSLATKHYWHFREFCLEDQLSLRIWNKHFLSLARGSERIFTISKVVDDYYCDKYLLTNTTMLYNDISSEYINYSNKKHRGINILITGTISESKGQIYAIEVMRKISNKNIKLYIAGEINEYAKKLMRYTNKKRITNVFFCGLITDMRELRSNIDISIICAKKEAFGRTIIEDMLNKIIVIGCNVGAVVELIEDGKTGYIYEYGNIEDLYDKIMDCINDKNLNAIRECAFRFASRFTCNATAIEIERVMGQ